MQCKIDILNEHAGRMTAKRDMPKYGVTRVSGLMLKTKKHKMGSLVQFKTTCNNFATSKQIQ